MAETERMPVKPATPEIASEPELAPDFTQWQRISPVAILYFISSTLQLLLGNLLFLIPGLVVLYQKLTAFPEFAVPGLLGLLLLLLIYAGLSYYFYQFRVAQDSVEIRAGVFAKKHLNLPFARIQNITMEQPFYYRLTGFVCLELDTAGSAKQEAKIVALPLEPGHQLKQHILKYRDVQSDLNTADVASEPQEGDETLLNQRSISDLVIHGITNNRVWILLGAAAPFYDNAATYLGDYLKSFGIDLQAMFSEQSMAWWQLGLYALSLAMVVMLVITLLSVFGSILMFYGFSLSKAKDRYIRRCGLITRQEISMKLSRLQLVVRKQDWLDMLLGRINLTFEQNNSGLPGDNGLRNQNSLIVPSVKEQECNALIKDALPQNKLAEARFTAISRHFIWRNLLLFVLPLFGAFLSITLYHQKVTESLVMLSVMLLVSLLVFLRWRRWGYAYDNDFVYIRKGLIGVDYYCFPIYKVQQIKQYQSLFMKPRQLATCHLVLASGGLKIPFMPEGECGELGDLCLYEVESGKRSWM